jgi:ATP-dependent Clp protease protease subunit
MRRRQWYRIQNAAKTDEATVYIYQEIESFWGVSAHDFVRELAGIKASTIHVRINSPGGDVFDGMAIYNALKRHPSEIVTHVDGLAASAASIIALAGDRVVMGVGSFLMIHNAWGIVIGDAKDMREMADSLEKITGSLAGIYATRTGKPADEIQAMLDAETWLSAEEAVEGGFADETEDAPKASASFDLSRFRNVPDPLKGARSDEPAKIETIRDFEAFLRDEGGFSNAAAKSIAAAGFKGTTPEPRDEDGAGQTIRSVLAELAHTRLAASLTH